MPEFWPREGEWPQLRSALCPVLARSFLGHPSYFLFLVIAGDSVEDPEETFFLLFKGSDNKYFRHLVSVAITQYYHGSVKSVTDNV